MARINSFEELECWKAATSLRREISIVLKKFPSDEKYELVSQLRRASRSVTNNIAEGFGRYHYQEYIRFCRISRASLMEVLDHLIIANDECYISDSELIAFRLSVEKTKGLLNGFINYLEARKSRSNKVEEPLESYGLGKQEYVFDTEHITSNI